LTGWQISGEVVYAFPEGTLLGTGESMVLVSFDPESANGRNIANVFKFALGMDLSAPLFARLLDPDVGTRTRDALRDEGALVQLVRPGVPAAGLPDQIPLIVVDQVDYTPEAPWPDGTVETGQSLTRTGSRSHGSLPSSWVAAPASPGSTNFFDRITGDANDSGQVDQSDLDLLLQSGKYRSQQAATWSQGDWNGDGVFDQHDIIAALLAGSFASHPFAARAVDRAMAE
jgi:hypothetical protein